MSVLDNNFDSSREMPSRASWLDNASAQLLSDNSYFNGATRGTEPSWLGNVDFFDSSRTASVAAEAVTQEEPVPSPESPEPAPTPEQPTEPAPEPAPTPDQPPAVEQVPEVNATAPVEPVGPRVATGPMPPDVHARAVAKGVLYGPPPAHDGAPDTVTSRNGASGKSGGRAADASASAGTGGTGYVDAGPGPDGRNSDGTYGAGHHEYTLPASEVHPNHPVMTEYDRPALAEEPAAPEPTPKVAGKAALQALIAAMKRYKETGETGQTGTPNEGPGIATVDPNWVKPEGAFGNGIGGGRRGG